MSPTTTHAWRRLAQVAQNVRKQPIADLIADPSRNAQLQLNLAGLHFDFSKQWVTKPALNALFDLAAECQVMSKAQAMFAGEPVNFTENRAALHTLLRQPSNTPGLEAVQSVRSAQRQMSDFTTAVRTGQWRGCSGKPINDIVHIGIGGSHLGPALVVQALAASPSPRLNAHFVANIDAHALFSILARLDPETTLFIIASKSFTTLETRINAQSARSWFLERTARPDAIAQHFVAVSTNEAEAGRFGIPRENLFPLWDWVGGRYSLWSPVGLPIALTLGMDTFNALLAGAREVDDHFLDASPSENVPLLCALLATWNNNFLGAATLAVLCYDERLALLPEYLQQLEMESNGKRVNRAGEVVDHHTMGVLWGGLGTRGQHAYHQLLHQGTRAYAADFMLVGRDDRGAHEHHRWLLANALGQSQAMAIGQTSAAEPHKDVPGNHPTSTIVLDALAPRQIGALLAVYEHKVFCQGAIWDINSFDQWGVELGKRLAEPIYARLADATAHHEQDAATQALIDHLCSISTKEGAP